jgi:hypothetical protein
MAPSDWSHGVIPDSASDSSPGCNTRHLAAYALWEESAMKRWCVAMVLVAVAAGCGPCECEQEAEQSAVFPHLEGPYLGQPVPGDRPEMFAPGIVSTGLPTRDVAMMPDGSELYFAVSVGAQTVIMETRQREGVWTEPVVAPFSGVHFDIEPCISHDGRRFFFLSNRPAEGQEPQPGWANQDIWVMDRVGDEWSDPVNLGPPVNTEAGEFFPSLTRDGTLYFTREGEDGVSAIYRARPDGDGFAEPERLGPEVNHGRNRFNAYVDPDERYLIVPSMGREDGLGGVDYYVVFRSEDDRWSEPVNMGPVVNQAAGREWSAQLSPDGRFLFFMSSRDAGNDPGPLVGRTLADLLGIAAEPGNGASAIWWVDAAFIEELRPDSL